MSEPYIGEIKMFGGNFAIRSFAFCNGQLLPIAQNTALFSILGTTYGGDGRTTFGLPNLMGRTPMDFGNGPGLTSRSLGETGGETGVQLTTATIPSHNHLMQCNQSGGNSASPSGGTFGSGGRGDPPFFATQGTAVPMAVAAIDTAGGSQAHNNMQPYLCVNFIIALQGIFPPRS